MAKVRKLFGELPEKVHVLCEVAEFNKEGIAEVSAEAANVFMQCYGYEIIETSEDEENTEDENSEEDENTSEEEEVKPKRAPARKAAPRK